MKLVCLVSAMIIACLLYQPAEAQLGPFGGIGLGGSPSALSVSGGVNILALAHSPSTVKGDLAFTGDFMARVVWVHDLRIKGEVYDIGANNLKKARLICSEGSFDLSSLAPGKQIEQATKSGKLKIWIEKTGGPVRFDIPVGKWDRGKMHGIQVTIGQRDSHTSWLLFKRSIFRNDSTMVRFMLIEPAKGLINWQRVAEEYTARTGDLLSVEELYRLRYNGSGEPGFGREQDNELLQVITQVHEKEVAEKELASDQQKQATIPPLNDPQVKDLPDEDGVKLVQVEWGKATRIKATFTDPKGNAKPDEQSQTPDPKKPRTTVWRYQPAPGSSFKLEAEVEGKWIELSLTAYPKDPPSAAWERQEDNLMVHLYSVSDVSEVSYRYFGDGKPEQKGTIKVPKGKDEYGFILSYRTGATIEVGLKKADGEMLYFWQKLEGGAQ